MLFGVFRKIAPGQDKGKIAMKILNGKVFENGKLVEKDCSEQMAALFAEDSGDGLGTRRSGAVMGSTGHDRYSFSGLRARSHFCDGNRRGDGLMAEYELQNGDISSLLHPATMTLTEGGKI